MLETWRAGKRICWWTELQFHITNIKIVYIIWWGERSVIISVIHFDSCQINEDVGESVRRVLYNPREIHLFWLLWSDYVNKHVEFWIHRDL